MVEHSAVSHGLVWLCDVPRVVAPSDVMVLERDPLMPFEAKDTLTKASGAKVIKKQLRRASRPSSKPTKGKAKSR